MIIEHSVENSFFLYQQDGSRQNETQFTLIGSQERPTMKKQLKHPKRENTAPNLQRRQLSPFELNKIVSEYDQEIPQSQTAEKPIAPRGRARQQSRDTRKTN